MLHKKIEALHVRHGRCEMNKFQKGDKVKLIRLQSKKHWNGKIAVIIAPFSKTKKRWPLRLIDDKSEALIKTENLQKYSEPTQKELIQLNTKLKMEQVKYNLLKQRESLSKNTLKINYVNPSNKRDLELHGSDTRLMLKRTKELDQFLTLIGKDKEPVYFMRTHPTLCMEYGHCQKNCNNAVKLMKDACVGYGYAIFEGKYCIEMEAHCVVMVKTGQTFNVTQTYGLNKAGEGLFLFDREMILFVNKHKSMPVSKLYWKGIT